MIRPNRTLRAAAVARDGVARPDRLRQQHDTASDNKRVGELAASAGRAKGDGTLTIGTLLPADRRPRLPRPAGVRGRRPAVKDINAAGGVLGKDVVQVKADSGDGTPDIAGASVDKLLDANADVIVGAASSAVSLSVIDKIIGAGVVQFSPGQHLDRLRHLRRQGPLLPYRAVRRAPGPVLANLVVEDGDKNVAIMARQDSYGEGLAEQVEKAIEEKGGTSPPSTSTTRDARTTPPRSTRSRHASRRPSC